MHPRDCHTSLGKGEGFTVSKSEHLMTDAEMLRWNAWGFGGEWQARMEREREARLYGFNPPSGP